MRQLTTALAALAALTSVADAQATVVRRATLDELVQSSALVLHGTVLRVDERAGEARGAFRTEVELAVVEPLKGLGQDQPTLSFELSGGLVGNRRMRIPGMPRLAAGDELVVLLERRPGGYAFTGLSQGVFRVRREGDAARVERRMEGATLLDERGREVAPSVEPGTLDELVLRLRAIIDGEER